MEVNKEDTSEEEGKAALANLKMAIWTIVFFVCTSSFSYIFVHFVLCIIKDIFGADLSWHESYSKLSLYNLSFANDW